MSTKNHLILPCTEIPLARAMTLKEAIPQSPVTEEQKRLLDQRHAEHVADPKADVTTWDEAKARLFKRL